MYALFHIIASLEATPAAEHSIWNQIIQTVCGDGFSIAMTLLLVLAAMGFILFQQFQLLKIRE